MDLSVIIVSWNAKRYLLECLESIRAQGLSSDRDIIVVDNCSSDGSPEAVADVFPAITLIRNGANDGFAKANNIGIRASSGDYLFLVNSDVVVGQDCFRRMLDYMESHPRIGVLGPRITGADGHVQRSCMEYPSLWNMFARALALDVMFPTSRLFGAQLMTFWRHDVTRPVDVVNGCFWLVRRSALAEVGLLDERFLIYGEDIDWCRRFQQHGWGVVFYPEATALHYGGASSSNAPVAFYVEMQKATYQYWLKHHSRLSGAGFLAINMLHHVVRIAGECLSYPMAPGRRKLARENILRAWASLKWAASAAGDVSGRRLVAAGARLPDAM